MILSCGLCIPLTLTQELIAKYKAVIDMGTNTFHLLVAEVENNTLKAVYEEKRPVKLGKGGIENGLITSAAYDRAITALSNYAEIAEQYQIIPEEVLVVATSAVRSAKNSAEFVKRIADICRLKVNVISGIEEAEYILKGVRADVDLSSPCLIMDIGGGSVEFVVADSEQTYFAKSYEIGGQRLMDRFMTSDPISFGGIEALNAFASDALTEVFKAAKKLNVRRLVGSAGTFDTLLEIYQLSDFEGDKETKSIPLDFITYISGKFCTLNQEERMQIPGMITLRVDMIVVATLLLEAVIRSAGINELKVSHYALKEGYLLANL